MHLRQTHIFAALLCAMLLVIQATGVSVPSARAAAPLAVAGTASKSTEVTYVRTRKIMEMASEIANESAEAVQKFQTLTLDEDFAGDAIRKYTASIIQVEDVSNILENEADLNLTLLRLDMPVRNGSLSSPYGWRNGRPHKGIDFSAPIGSPIRAAEEGRVVFSGWYYGYGYMVTVEHAPGIRTRYAHCSSLLAKIGQHVSRGQVIARVGSTGHSTGPHLHFELLTNGVNINPKNYIIKPGEHLKASL